MLVHVVNDCRLFVVKYKIKDTFVLTTFFPTYTPNGSSMFETFMLPANEVIPFCSSQHVPIQTSGYDFQIGDRVRYIGTVRAILCSLEGKFLTIETIGLKDIGCVRDDETHLRFFCPAVLELI
jgi:hypothetical protein